MIGIGVIGLGAVSDDHLRGLESVDGVRIAAVCDLDEARAAEAARLHGAVAYSDYSALLADPSVAGVLVLLPHALHLPVARAAIEAGKHVCLEKPMALTAEECQSLCALAERRGLTLAVAENSRYAEAYIAAQRAVVSGELGRIRLVRGFVHGSAVRNYERPDAGWRIEPGGVGAIIDAAPHQLFLLKWMFGGVKTLRAITRHWVREHALPSIAVEDGALIDGKLAGGGYYSLEVSMSAEIPWGERLEIYGESGSIVIDHLMDPPMRSICGGDDLVGTPQTEVEYDPSGWQAASIAAAAADFATCIRDGSAPGVTGEDGLWTATAIDAAYRSASVGGSLVEVATATSA